MKASSMQNHFDVTQSKCRQTKPIVWVTLLILMSRHADRSGSSLYLADLCNINLQPFVTEGICIASLLLPLRRRQL